MFDADYLSNNAAALQIALSKDEETSRKIKEALEIFGRLEEESVQFLRKALSAHEAWPGRTFHLNVQLGYHAKHFVL